jgi:lipoprotein NlpI
MIQVIPMTAPLAVFSLLICAFAAFAQRMNEQPREILDRALADFQQGRIAESVDGFDRVAKLVPNYAPQLWQRGIALYYAGRYKDCRGLFESHRTVNPDDVENAAWHFLCVARGESAEKARRALLPVGPDSRVPMREIYKMFRGEYTPEQVMRAAGDRIDAQFYAYLYTGLYYEALGDAEHALRQLREAAGDRFSAAGYMHDVARVHRDLLSRAMPRIP